MVGSVGNSFVDSREEQEKTELLWPEEVKLANGKASESNGAGENRAIVLGRNMHTVSYAIKEPESDDELTGEREGYMASVLAKYRRSLVERTKHHLGCSPLRLQPACRHPMRSPLNLLCFLWSFIHRLPIQSGLGLRGTEPAAALLHQQPRRSLHREQLRRALEAVRGGRVGLVRSPLGAGEARILGLHHQLRHRRKPSRHSCGVRAHPSPIPPPSLHNTTPSSSPIRSCRRECFPDGILYASKESHYSVFKAARMYRMQCVKVDTLTSGEIDCIDFRAKLLDHKDKPAILNVNIGEPVLHVFLRLCDSFQHHSLILAIGQAPKVTFKKPIGSVSVSGHKFVGCPMPCGVQITRLRHINALASNVEYLASRDATIMGSRNGHAPLFLWYALNRNGYRGFQKEVQKCLRNAHYLRDRLMAAGVGAMLNPLSSTVVFERPEDEGFVRRWQLACEGSIAHVVVMPSVTIEKLDDFLDELVAGRSAWYRDRSRPSPCIAAEIGQENCLCGVHKK
ncbi:hypothetical protein BHM03_00017558 [Ensete ventricosum]|uniref:Serine decarboxylase n=1 Tax=Ensete ventricosum TaxID=4639 RepID=A0A445MF02_ENSVE|nr:hypothetical protein BHM03_00017558 [Ensete ventricosum]